MNEIERLQNILAATQAELDGADKVIDNLKSELSVQISDNKHLRELLAAMVRAAETRIHPARTIENAKAALEGK